MVTLRDSLSKFKTATPKNKRICNQRERRKHEATKKKSFTKLPTRAFLFFRFAARLSNHRNLYVALAYSQRHEHFPVDCANLFAPEKKNNVACSRRSRATSRGIARARKGKGKCIIRCAQMLLCADEKERSRWLFLLMRCSYDSGNCAWGIGFDLSADVGVWLLIFGDSMQGGHSGELYRHFF